MISIDLNSDGLVEFTNKLEKIHQSAFPNAVRGTLNSLAFDVKQKTMPKEAVKFVTRNKTFFRATSRVEKAKGFNVLTMKSLVGFKPNSNTKNNKAVEELEQQEKGGIIKDRKLIPLKGSRISGSNRRNVRGKNRISKLNASRIKKSTKKTFVRDVHNAGKGGYVRTEKSILEIVSIRKNTFKFKRIYKVNKVGTVKINKATHFMRNASLNSVKKTPLFYEKEAKRQFERFYNS